MKILWILGELPIPTDSGGTMRVMGLLKELAPRHEVTAAVLDPGSGNSTGLDTLKSMCRRLEILPWQGRLSKTKMAIGAALSVVSPLPYGVIKYCDDASERAIADIIASQQFDVIQCENVGFRKYLRAEIQAKKVLNTQNVEANVWRQRTKITKDPSLRSFYHSQARKMAAYERWLIQQYDMILAVSESDEMVFRYEYSAKNTAIIPNAIGTDYCIPLSEPVEENLVVFTGAMDYPPNHDAMIYFLEDIWPHIIRKQPHARLMIVGRQPSRSLQSTAAKSANVTVTGWVEDTRPYLARARVVIIPLRMGGGSRLKLLEAMALSKTIVSTSVGAEGITVIPDTHLLVADTPHQFAEKVEDVLQCTEKYSTLGKNARNLVQEKYTWRTVAGNLERVWQSLC